MTIYLIADPHIGNHRRFGGEMRAGLNERCRRVLAVFGRALARLQENDTLVVLGDVFDVASPSPAVIGAAMGELRIHMHPRSEALLISGNHDMASTETGALEPLRWLRSQVNVCIEPTVVHRGHTSLMLAGYQPGPPSEWLPGVVGALVEARDQAPQQQTLLCLHVGIEDETTPPFLKGTGIHVDMLRYLCAEHDIDAVFAGDWHKHRVWRFDRPGGRKPLVAAQVGALVPCGFDDPGFDGYGTLIAVDSDGRMLVEFLAGPRFLTVDWRGTEPEAWPPIPAWAVPGTQLYVRALVDPENVHAADAWLRSNAANFDQFEISPCSRAAQIAAKQAGYGARNAESLDEAIGTYIQHVPLADGIDRVALTERVRSYVKQGGEQA